MSTVLRGATPGHIHYDTIMVWTTEVGGKMQCAWTTHEIYERARATGRLNVTPHLDDPTWVELKMVALAPVVELHDFVLERIRQT